MSPEISPIYKFSTKSLDSHPSVPGTPATQSIPVPNLKRLNPFPIRVEPGYLPSRITDQPLAYLQYGAAPVVITLHFRQKEKAHED
jgi:hypothetical protein